MPLYKVVLRIKTFAKWVEGKSEEEAMRLAEEEIIVGKILRMPTTEIDIIEPDIVDIDFTYESGRADREEMD